MPYRIEYAKSGRAACKGPKACKDSGEDSKMEKGSLRLGSVTKMPGADGDSHDTAFWRHWGCVTEKVITNMRDEVGEAAELDGYEELTPEDQEKIKQAFVDGHVAESDLTPALKEGEEAKAASKAEKDTAKAAKEKEKEDAKAAKEAAKAEKEAAKAAKKAEQEAKKAEREAKKSEKAEKAPAKKTAKKSEEDGDNAVAEPLKKRSARSAAKTSYAENDDEREGEDADDVLPPAKKKRG